MTRISRKDLDRKAEILNGLLGQPVEPYTRNPDGTYTLNRGTVAITGAYGGWDVVLGDGYKSLMGYHGTAREADKFLSGMIAALELLLPRDEFGRVTSWDVTYSAIPRKARARR